MLKRGSPLYKLLGAEEIGLFLLVDSYWGYLISHWLAILLFIVGFSTKPNAETVVSHWIMIWCWLFLTRIDVMYIVQDRWGLLADENRESLGAVNCVERPPWRQIFEGERAEDGKIFNTVASPNCRWAGENGIGLLSLIHIWRCRRRG